MNYMEKLLMSLKKMDRKHHYIIGILVVLFAVVIFYPSKKVKRFVGGYVEQFSNLKDLLESDKPTFVAFVVSWCGYCKKLKPEWEKLEKEYTGSVEVISIDCEKYKDLAKKYEISGYPTIKYFSKGLKNNGEDYTGGRTSDDFMKFLSSK